MPTNTSLGRMLAGRYRLPLNAAYRSTALRWFRGGDGCVCGLPIPVREAVAHAHGRALALLCLRNRLRLATAMVLAAFGMLLAHWGHHDVFAVIALGWAAYHVVRFGVFAWELRRVEPTDDAVHALAWELLVWVPAAEWEDGDLVGN